MSLPSPVSTYHTKTYSTISPTSPALSQKGKNVFICGATSGIGREMALSFAKAKVSNLAILGRRQNLLDELKTEITKSDSNINVHTYAADLTDFAALEKAFGDYASVVGGSIHTLIANAGYSPGFTSILDSTEEELTQTLSINVNGTRNAVRAFIPHISKENLPGSAYQAQIIHTSTGAVHSLIPNNSTYSVAKVAALRYMEAVSIEFPQIQVISFHPGLLKTGMVEEEAMGLTFDDISLPADWAVWAATNESSFLGTGRMVWAHWDVTELKSKFEQMSKGELSDGVNFGPVVFNKNFQLNLSGWPTLA